MIGIYFSGTGNSEYCVKRFIKELDEHADAFSIEDPKALNAIQQHQQICIGYPVQYSNIPKILKDFIYRNRSLWKNKDVFIIATMGLFSGDGAGILARLLHSYGANILGGLHLKMPDSIGDEKVLKRSLAKNKALVKNAEKKIVDAVKQCKHGTYPQEGIGFFSHIAGLFGQILYFYHKTKNYSDQVTIDLQKCIGCGLCEKLCPMNNIQVIHHVAVANHQCTLCYRCVNKCPVQAITILGKRVVEQASIEKYLP